MGLRYLEKLCAHHYVIVVYLNVCVPITVIVVCLNVSALWALPLPAMPRCPAQEQSPQDAAWPL